MCNEMPKQKDMNSDLAKIVSETVIVVNHQNRPLGFAVFWKISGYFDISGCYHLCRVSTLDSQGN